MTRKELDEFLPGDPSKLLVSKVRKHLKSYGILPTRSHWRNAWTWANAVAATYAGVNAMMGTPRKKSWPTPAEIGTQYLVLVLAEMRDNFALKLPYRAGLAMPAAVSVALSTNQTAPTIPLLALEAA